ncbi:hypothetical protein [Aureimonas sp. AU12]|uniref:hypothetical protein n=1 Tax=Aureimonas sp. AU12 TaxID=1638161 RepID=UPI000782B35E|nr:hypothetical protein [Aureimonas sp. AU12]
MFDLSLLLHKFAGREPRLLEAGEVMSPRAKLTAVSFERSARVGDRVFTEALAGLGHPLNAG